MMKIIKGVKRIRPAAAPVKMATVMIGNIIWNAANNASGISKPRVLAVSLTPLKKRCEKLPIRLPSPPNEREYPQIIHITEATAIGITHIIIVLMTFLRLPKPP